MKARDGHRFRSRDSESNGTNRRRVPGGGGDITREDEITAVVGRLLFLCGSNGFTPSVSLSVKMKRRKHTIFLLVLLRLVCLEMREKTTLAKILKCTYEMQEYLRLYRLIGP